MKKRWLFLAGASSFIVSSVLNFPLSLVIDKIPKDQIQILNPQGSLFNGSAQSALLVNQQIELSNVNWMASFQSLLNLKIGTNVSFQVMGADISSQIAKGFGDTIYLSDLKTATSADLIEKVIGLPILKFGGELSSHLSTLEIADQLPQNINGTVSWNRAEVIGQVSAKLGNIVIAWNGDKEQSIGTLSNKGGQLKLSGTITLKEQGLYSANAVISPQPNTDQMILNTLNFIGERQSNGDYNVTEQGNLKELLSQ